MLNYFSFGFLFSTTDLMKSLFHWRRHVSFLEKKWQILLGRLYFL